MKLNEVWNILEMFNFKQNLKWFKQKSDWEEDIFISSFEVEDEQYKFEIYQRTIVLPERKIIAHEALFRRRLRAGEYTIKTTASNHSQKVFSVVYNGMVDHIKKYKPEVIVFSVKRGEYTDKEESQRIRIYKNIGDYISRQGGYNLFPPTIIKIPSYATLFILVKNGINLTKEEKNIIMNQLKGEKI